MPSRHSTWSSSTSVTPKDFGWLAPVVDNGYTSVSFFLLLSGFILAYNYSDRAARGEMAIGKFWLARFSRLYPVYVFSLIVSLSMLATEFHAQSMPLFIGGIGLTLLLVQGWSPTLSTFWNTPAWTMSTEAFFYLIFPLAVRWKRPQQAGLAGGAARGAMVGGHGLPCALYLVAPRWRSASRPLFKRMVDSGVEIYASAAPAFVSLRSRSGRSERPFSDQQPLASGLWGKRSGRPILRSGPRRAPALRLPSRWPTDASLWAHDPRTCGERMFSRESLDFCPSSCSARPAIACTCCISICGPWFTTQESCRKQD